MTRVSIWTYRMALLACPPDFRRRFGARMLEDFRALLKECGGGATRVAMALRESTDVVRAAWRDARAPQHLSPLGPGRPPARERLRLAWDDVTFAARSLRSRPGYATVSVLTLALGIGASTIVFSVIDKVLIEPLPYPGSERLVYLFANDLTRERVSRMPTTPGDFRDWAELSTSFETITATRSARGVLTGGSHPERISLTEFSDDVFRMLGARPHLGALLGPDSAATDLVLAHSVWERMFAADESVIGREVQIDGLAHTIVGVTAPGFRHPLSTGGIWRPLRFEADEVSSRTARSLIVLAKLGVNSSPGQALEELTTVAAALGEQYPETNETWGVHLLPAKDLYLEDSRQMYLVLGAAVGLVFLVACVNLASLVLARGASRQTEMAVRMALGAGRGRVIGLLLAEGALVAAAAAGVGVLVAAWGLAAILTMAPSWPIVLRETTMTGRSIAFVVVLAFVALQVYSVLPAVRMSRPRLGDALRGTSRAASGSKRDLRFRRLLVMAQISLAVVLLIGASLLVRSVVNILNADSGYDFRNVISARVMLAAGSDGADVYFDELLRRAEALPGVTSAAVVDAAPMDGTGDWVRVFVDGARIQRERALGADYRRVSASYFETLGIDLVAGRLLTDDDVGASVAVVNQDFANRFLAGKEPLGAVVGTAPSTGADTELSAEWRIVGVVETVQEWGPTSFVIPMIYVPHAADPSRSMSLLLRSETPADGLLGPIREIVREIGDNPIDRVNPLEAYFRGTYQTQRFMLALLGSFAALAITLSAIGLYGVMAFNVMQRYREIGVRVALGANRRRVAGMVLRQGALLAVLAVGVGVAGAVPMARTLSNLSMGTLLVDMHWFDPIAFTAVPLLVLATAMLASWIPARRAARVDPVEALRADG